jgi:hypothetical protein
MEVNEETLVYDIPDPTVIVDGVLLTRHIENDEEFDFSNEELPERTAETEADKM